jgi:hypothetical protein
MLPVVPIPVINKIGYHPPTTILRRFVKVSVDIEFAALPCMLVTFAVANAIMRKALDYWTIRVGRPTSFLGGVEHVQVLSPTICPPCSFW